MDLIVEFVVVVVVVEEVMVEEVVVEEVVVVAVRELIDVAWRIIVKYTLRLRHPFIHGVTRYEYSVNPLSMVLYVIRFYEMYFSC